ncbi:uncharacterized protein LOC111634539 [Centruroides sculpturatus]|uniref:uncharacterized protein LOC111634539 n=1 Tax=Centruroides sculpturatus TaxID=218467 RepID=UPI000C6D12AC|nr:uncharacterized protein LOC111634539 [Centruroides sculpturatus]
MGINLIILLVCVVATVSAGEFDIATTPHYSFLSDVELLLREMQSANPQYYYNNSLVNEDEFSTRQSRRYVSRSKLKGLGEDVLILLRSIANLVVDPLGSNKGNTTKPNIFSNGLAGLSEYLMALVENSLDDLPSLPRLDPQECMKRSICEAHNQPKKYGLIGLIIQLLFPPYTKTDDANNVVSKYQLAARYGRQSSANCANQYDGCMINVLDIIKTVAKVFIR